MAISLDNTTFQGNQGSASVQSFSHTCSGSNRILLLGVLGEVGSDLITGVTYDGVSMNLVGKALVSGDRYVYLFSLIAPATGTNTVEMTASSGCFMQGFAASYTGAAQTSQPEADGTKTGSGGSFSHSLTTLTDGALLFSMTKTENGDIGAGSSTTLVEGGPGDSAQTAVFSRGPEASAGSYTMNYTNTSSGDWASVIASIAPVVATYEISGTVTLDGSPVENATVRCIRQSDNTAISEETTDSNGDYTFSDLDQNEEYHLAVEYADGGQDYNALSLWDITPEEV